MNQTLTQSVAEKLAQARCANHAGREAVARCPECRDFFCRECIVEHESRMICAQCLQSLAAPKASKPIRLTGLWRSFQFAVGVLVTWLCFYYAGRILISIPPAMHDAGLMSQLAKELEPHAP